MRTQSKFAVMAGLLVAVAVQASACRPPPSGASCGDERCPEGEICRVAQTATTVQSMCVRDDGNDMGGDGRGPNGAPAICGDGAVTAGEMCDDGNTEDFDGCKNDCTVRLHTYIKASNTNSDAGALDEFGFSVALSADGSTLAVAAPGESSAAIGVGGDQADRSAGGAGAVYVFTRGGTTWIQQAYLKASNTGQGDGFGTSLALSADGSTLAVGASEESSAATGVGSDQADDSAFFAGAAYVFTRSGTTWTQQAYIKASNTDEFDLFGSSVALSADGSTLAVGANFESSAATGIDGDQADNSAEFAGAVYVFTRSGATWTQQAYLKASNTDAADEFGANLALSADGSTLAVGARFESSAATDGGSDQADNSADSAGAAYVFTRDGTTWTQQAYLKASNTDEGDEFGESLALSADGSTLAIGAIRESSATTGIGGDQASNSAGSAGAVYVFTRGTTWTQQAYLKASNTDAGDLFGESLALSANGSTLAVSAIGESSATTGIGGDQASNSAGSAGAAYMFTRSGTTWTQQAYLKASNTHANDLFGASLALSAGGSTLVVGANWESSAATGVDGDQTDHSAPLAGAAYVFY
jgi:cysteine-rich repeat protein